MNLCRDRRKRMCLPFTWPPYIMLGDRERALSALEQAYQEHDQYMIYVKVDINFDPLRSEPRFQAVLRGMNFP